MRKLQIGAVDLLAVFCLLTLASVPIWAQVEDQEQPTLTLQDVKDRLKENKRHLDEARNRSKAGDAAGVETAIESYNHGMTGLNRALDAGRFEGDEAQREEALARVEKANRKNGEVLSGLLNKVPEQARPGIEQALASSQKGRAMALANLEQARATRQERMAAEERQGTNQRSTAGRPEGVGRPSGASACPLSDAGPAGAIGGRGPRR